MVPIDIARIAVTMAQAKATIEVLEFIVAHAKTIAGGGAAVAEEVKKIIDVFRDHPEDKPVVDAVKAAAEALANKPKDDGSVP